MRDILLYITLILILILTGCNEKANETFQEITTILDSDYYSMVKSLVDDAENSIEVMMFLVSDTTENFGEPGGLLSAISDAYSRGIDIRVLLNTIEIGNIKAIEYLKIRGISVKKADKYSHTKLIIIDDGVVVLGSHNWTASAFGTNYEASILIRDEVTASKYKNYFNEHYDEGVEL